MRDAIKKLENNGYYIDNQFDGFFGTIENEYELYKGDEVVKDHLNEAQVIEFANTLQEVGIMKQYKGYYIDGMHFKNKEQIDEFIKANAVESYKTACRLF